MRYEMLDVDACVVWASGVWPQVERHYSHLWTGNQEAVRVCISSFFRVRLAFLVA